MNEAGAIDQDKLEGARIVGTNTLLVRAFDNLLPAGYTYDTDLEQMLKM